MRNPDLLNDAAARAQRYLDGVADRSVAPRPEAVAALQGLDEPLPEGPTDPMAALALLDRIGSPATVATAGPRYFGYVVGGALEASVAAGWLASAWDQNANMISLSPAACAIERVAARWLIDVLGLPQGAHCAFVTGTTTAHITALTAARDAVLARAGFDVRAHGLRGAPEVRVVVGGEVHPSLLRALRVVGFGEGALVRIEVDGQGRMRPDALPEIAGPTIVCAQAGNVNTGASDPVAALREAAPSAWLHVDGAFGLWANASPATRDQTRGIETADSWATDGHKWLNVPYDSGMAIVRAPAALRRSLAMAAPYLEQDQADPMDFTLEMSRRARAVEVWAALRTLGRSGVVDLVDRCCRHARRFAAALAGAGFEILNEVRLNQVLVSFGDARTTQRVIAGVQQEGTCWCGGTRWQGRDAMRISTSSWATTDADVDRSVQAMIRLARAAKDRGR